jgi:hypothetical protein
MQRHLVAISRFTLANLMLFFKSAGWMMPALIIFYVYEELRHVNSIMFFWLCGLFASLSLGLVGLPKEISFYWPNLKYILTKYLSALPIVLIGTIATRALFAIDRILIEELLGLEAVGIYGVYAGIAAAFIAVLDAGILTRAYPLLVTSALKDQQFFRNLVWRIQFKICLFTISSLIIYGILIEFFLHAIDKPNLVNHVMLGAHLIISYGVYALSFPLNCRLYALGLNKEITIINILSLIPIAIPLTVEAVSMYSFSTVAIFSAALHVSLRYFLHWRLNNK